MRANKRGPDGAPVGVDDTSNTTGGDPATGNPNVLYEPYGERPAPGTPGMDGGAGAPVAEPLKDRFAGVKVWSAFFGWLTAVGATLLLTVLAAAAAAMIGLTAGIPASAATSYNTGTVGLAGSLTLVVVVLIAYFGGGYVAGRMAFANGLWQGLVVWLWGIVISAAAVAIGVIAGTQYNVQGQVGSPSQLPLDWAALTAYGVLTAILVAAAALIGALLGGAAGAHHHFRIARRHLAYRP